MASVDLDLERVHALGGAAVAGGNVTPGIRRVSSDAEAGPSDRRLGGFGELRRDAGSVTVAEDDARLARTLAARRH